MTRLGLVGAGLLFYLGMPCGVGMAEPANGLAANSPMQSAIGPASGASAQLAQLNAQIMRHPQDTALNLRYAALAEQLGERRLALTAYERILIYDPQNVAALAGVDRVRNGLRPNTTQYLAKFGGIYESNPTYFPGGFIHSEGQAFGDLNMRDERSVGDTRWRTLANVDGIVHGDQTQLDYGYAGATTGPIWELLPGLQVNPALGGGASYFDSHFFYGEAIASTTFEFYPDGAYESVKLRAAFRDYDTFFVPGQYGGYVDATGRFTVPLAVPDTVFSFSPWLRWSSIKGELGTVTSLNTVQPGDYTEFGGRLDGFYGVNDWLVLAANIEASGRYYRDEVVVNGTAERKDTTIAPGAAIIFPHVLAYQNDLRFDYKYIWDHSNDNFFSFVDHVVTVTAIRRF
jgi:hypothetical protein